MKAKDLFVFAGAGASASGRSWLPLFDPMRDAILKQLDLPRYVPSTPEAEAQAVDVARGLAPEPFFLALERSDAQVVPWLNEVLDQGTPNAAHHALAQLAAEGAAVWTVNFDQHIEQASGHALRVAAWGEEPKADSQLLKPHGTLGGELVVTSEQVLRGLSPSWYERLRSDVKGRTALFVGYSGRDVDFHPLWNDVLSEARVVYWFGREQQRLRRMMPVVSATGRLEFMKHAETPSPGQEPNRSWDFLHWCQHRGLVNISSDLIGDLFADRPEQFDFPQLKSDSPDFTRAKVAEILGATRDARRTYLDLLTKGPGRGLAAKAVVQLTINHGGRPVAWALLLPRLLPTVGGLAQKREIAERKRLTFLAKSGDHAAVLRGTTQLDDKSVSTLLILRSASLRFAGKLPEAASLAEDATRRAHKEGHPVRIAHAAYQWCQALLWAERLEDVNRVLDDELNPVAAIAASRWVAWADYISAGLLVREGKVDEALRVLQVGEARFRSEALTDGVVSIETTRLAALRLAGDDAAFEEQRTRLWARISDRPRHEMFYAQGHRFSFECVRLQEVEFLRIHQRRLAEARQVCATLAQSPYPLMATLALLEAALVDAELGGDLKNAQAAQRRGQEIGAGLVVSRAEALLANRADATRELFFC
ncbi:MAG TPA: SIR2 family protein [Actinomycetota bacterium]|nr:SIR2 family protein [Actinomycetota bacterium]